MPSSGVPLPCLSHRACDYHAYLHQSRTITSSTTPESPAAGNWISAIESRLSLTSKDKQSREPRTTPIQRLPVEILLIILLYVDSVDKACLALTCKQFASILGPDAWKGMNKEGKVFPSWEYPYARFLDCLGRDLNEDYWRCKACECFHPRNKDNISGRCLSTQGHIHKTPSRSVIGLKQIFSQSNRANDRDLGLKDGYNDVEPGFKIWISGTLVYNLTFPMVKAVMNRHFLENHPGACLESLRCSGRRMIAFSSTIDLILKYSFVSKIVLDRLLLKATYTIHQQDSKTELSASMTQSAFLKRSGLWICAHNDFEKVSQDGISRLKHSCQHCPTEYILRSTWNALTLEVWHNLGSGQSPSDVRWMHIVDQKRSKKLYEWKREDIEHAYERILCSTKLEFDRQVQNSDGRGDWYDPWKQTRGYKTLPISLAEAL